MEPPPPPNARSVTAASSTRRSESRQSSHSQSQSVRAASSIGRSSVLSGSYQSASLYPKTPKASAAKYGGLGEKELQKITSSIRTAVKTTGIKQRTVSIPDEFDLSNGNESAREPAPSGSFLAETSFTRAPLNSRLPPISPHRVALASARRTTSTKTSSKAAGKRPVNGTTYSDDEDDASLDEGDDVEDEFEPTLESEARKREGLDPEPLQGLSPEVQEALIVEDLFFVLMGIEGQYIEFDPSYTPEDEFERLQGAKFVVTRTLEPWITAIVSRFLDIARHYTSIQAFIEQYSILEHGVINHALCAAIRELLKEYLILLAQLENQFLTSPGFTLQRFWFYLHPSLHTLSLINSLTLDLVALNLPSDTGASSEESSDDDDDDDLGGGEEMRGILDEMKGAAKSAKKAGAQPPAGIAKGGEVLFVLSDKLERTSGDPAARELYTNLLLRASQPYVAILLGWISTGHLSDPWDEFIVREAKQINLGSLEMDYTDEYWDRRYTLRDKDKTIGKATTSANKNDPPRTRGLSGGAIVPRFLEPWKTKILLAGKYLNVMRECGIEIESRGNDWMKSGMMIAMNEENFYERIDSAYTYANKALLKLLLEEEHLVSRLSSIKQYFFIDHGDAFTHFLDLARPELSKSRKAASETKLQSLLELALRNPSSASAADPFKDDLKALLAKSTLTDWLLKILKVEGAKDGGDALGTGLTEGGRGAEQEQAASKEKEKDFIAYQAFTLDYNVRFPLSLVISRKTILRYQLLFRHLLQLKHTERVLAEMWTELSKSPLWRQRTQYVELEQWKQRIFGLRARMFAFVQQMYSFTVSEVLEVNWAGLKKKLEKVETVDQLLKDHVDFLDTCLKECSMTNEKLLVIHSKLLEVCTRFPPYASKFTDAIALSIASANKHDGDWTQVGFKKQWDTLASFEQHFNHHSKANLDRLTYHASRENASLLPLVVRLTNLKVPSLPA